LQPGFDFADDTFKELGYSLYMTRRFTIEIEHNEFIQWLAKIPAPKAAVPFQSAELVGQILIFRLMDRFLAGQSVSRGRP